MAETSFPTLLHLLEQAVAGRAFRMPLAEHLGFHVVHAEAGKVTVELEPKEYHRNIMGTVHGGVLCDIADAAMGLAFGTTLPAGQSFTTIELKINYLRPVFQQTVRAQGVVSHRGRNLGLIECRIVDEQDKLIAFATSTYTVLDGDSAQNRSIQPNFGARDAGER